MCKSGWRVFVMTNSGDSDDADRRFIQAKLQPPSERDNSSWTQMSRIEEDNLNPTKLNAIYGYDLQKNANKYGVRVLWWPREVTVMVPVEVWQQLCTSKVTPGLWGEEFWWVNVHDLTKLNAMYGRWPQKRKVCQIRVRILFWLTVVTVMVPVEAKRCMTEAL